MKTGQKLSAEGRVLKLVSELTGQIAKGRSPDDVADTLQMLVDNPRSIGVSTKVRQNWQKYWEESLQPHGYMQTPRLCSCLLDVIMPIYTCSFLAPLAKAPATKNLATHRCFAPIVEALGVKRVVALPDDAYWDVYDKDTREVSYRFLDSIQDYDSEESGKDGSVIGSHMDSMQLPSRSDMVLVDFFEALRCRMDILITQLEFVLDRFRCFEGEPSDEEIRRSVGRNLIDMIGWRVLLQYKRRETTHADRVLDLWRVHGYYPLTIARDMEDDQPILYVLSA